MAEHSRTLHFDRESQTSGVRLYTTQGEVTNPTVFTAASTSYAGTLYTTAADDITPALRLMDGNTTVYAPLVEVSGTAEGLMASVNGKNYNAPPITLEDLSFAEIKGIVNAGKHTENFKVGDTKTITINGTIESQTFTNKTIKLKILGFDHNKATETNGKSSITFGIADTEGRDFVLPSMRMNTSNTNSGGWRNSYMRSTVCNAFYNALPSNLQSVIGNVTKYSDNTGGGSNTASYVTATTDKIFLLSEYEVFGVRKYANSAEQNYQQQYDYYKNGGSHIRYNSGNTTDWWSRSVDTIVNSSYFCYVLSGVASTASTGVNRPDASLGFAPAFTIVAD